MKEFNSGKIAQNAIAVISGIITADQYCFHQLL